MPRPVSRWRRMLRWLVAVGFILVAGLLARSFYAFRDRSPGYTIQLQIDDEKSRAHPLPLRAGFARMKINPDLGKSQPPVWLAGFSQNRAATAIHDDLWAVACVLDDGYTRFGVVALDAIGFFHDDVIAVRRRLSPESKLDYAIVCATHNHSTPDLMGLWGPDIFHTGVNPRYREQVIAAAAATLENAARALQPVHLTLHEITTPPAGLVADTRRPEVFDPDLRVMQFTHPANGLTIGTIIGWANHPETVWGRNTEITADFPGYLRDALENGVREDGQMLAAGVGGLHLYVNGAIGGLMSTTPRVTVQDPYLRRDFEKPSHEKARAVGRQLAARILPRLQASHLPMTNAAPISIRARTLEVPLANNLFLLAPVLGLMDRGHVHWRKLRTEVALLTVGQASIACIPGEIYPELVNGGVEKAPGGDFAMEPLEIPPIRELMPGGVKFIFGLANDEIGYIIPKSQWDERPPYLYDAPKPVYGEVNSVGPDAAGAIHAALREFSQSWSAR